MIDGVVVAVGDGANRTSQARFSSTGNFLWESGLLATWSCVRFFDGYYYIGQNPGGDGGGVLRQHYLTGGFDILFGGKDINDIDITPDGEILIAFDRVGGITAGRYKQDGTAVWEYDTGSTAFGIAGFGATVIIGGNLSADKTLWGVNLFTGSELWTGVTHIGGGIRRVCFGRTEGGIGKIGYGCGSRGLYKFNADTGSILWSFEPGGVFFGYDDVCADSAGNFVYTVGGFLAQYDASDGNRNYNVSIGNAGPAAGGCALNIAEDAIYIATEDRFRKHQTSDGANLWTHTLANITALNDIDGQRLRK